MNLSEKYRRQYYEIVHQERQSDPIVTRFFSLSPDSYFMRPDAEPLSYFGISGTVQDFLTKLEEVYLKINGDHSTPSISGYDRIECVILGTDARIIPRLFICMDPPLTNPEKIEIIKMLGIKALSPRGANVVNIIG